MSANLLATASAIRSKVVSVCLLSALLLLAAPTLSAQTAHFSYAQQTIGSGLSFPASVAEDSSGNVFIADYSNGRVLKETPSGSGYTQTTIGSGFSIPVGVAVDSSGNVYVSDNGLNEVVKETLSGGTYTQSTIASGFAGSLGVAVDSSGNVYTSDRSGKVFKETPSGGSYTQTVILTGFSNPVGLAVDGSGNLYVGDGITNQVTKEIWNGSGYTQMTVGSGLNSPGGVAVDGNGNVYIADYYNKRVLKETLSSGVYTQTTLIGGLGGPEGVGVDGDGNVFVADSAGNQVLKLSTAGVDFGSVAVGASSSAVSLTFTFDSSGFGVPLKVVTQGATGQDFTDAGTGTCTTHGTSYAYSTGTTCTVNVIFSPKYAGLREGAAVLEDSSGAPIATAYVYGIGTGPQVVFEPGTQSVLFNSGLSLPAGVAVDGSGNIYISDESNSRVLKETPSGGGSYTQTTVGSGLNGPFGVAVDGSGNVYIADTNNNRVLKETPSGSGYTQTTIGSGFNQPAYPVVDGRGNLYFSDFGNNRVIEETPSGGGSYTQTTLFTGLNGPIGVALDNGGNIYIAQANGNDVLKETPSGGGSYTQTTVVSGLNSPYGLAVDSSGSLYIADSLNNRVVKESPSGGGSYTQTTIGSGLNAIFGVGLDSSGNVYIADSYNNQVLEVNVATLPSLTFASTAVGTTSSDSPQTVTLDNIGNAALTFPIPGAGNNPSIAAGFDLDNSSTCPQLSSSSGSAGTLAAGASCTDVINFTPVSGGNIIGSLSITDTNLNASPSVTQTISLSGTATQASQTITFTPPATPITFTTSPITLSASASSGLPITFTVTSGPATVTGDQLTLTGIGTVAVTASQAGDAEYLPATSVSNSIVVNQATTSTALAVSSNSIAGGSVLTLTATVISGGNNVAPGLVSFYERSTYGANTVNTPLYTAELVNGAATYKLFPGVGARTYFAKFRATTDFAKSVSSIQTVTVTGAATATTTTIQSSGGAGAYTLTATVAGTNLLAPPTGNVSFLDMSNGNLSLGTAALSGANVNANAAPASAFPVGQPATAVAVADVNGDGIPDLIVANLTLGPDGVSVLLGNADGTFQPAVNYNTGSAPCAMAIADFNGDGYPDIAVVDEDSDTVTILLNNGNGTFTLKSSPATGHMPISVVAGDFNGDGIVDLAVSNNNLSGTGSVSILIGNGDGTFHTAVPYAIHDQPTQIVAGDFNGDGITDLAVADAAPTANDVSILLGNGDGTFTVQSTYPAAGTHPNSLAVGDFNNDGKLDLAVANITSQNVTILLGNGNGTFTTTPSSPTTGAGPFAIVSGDFNHDGKPDLAVVNSGDNTVSVLGGNGDGTFRAGVTFAVGGTPTGVAAGDFNGDGMLDVVTANRDDWDVTVLLNTSTVSATATLNNVSIPGGGTHNIAASYPGDTNNTASSSSTISLTGTPISTTTSISVSPATTVPTGVSLQLSAAVAPFPADNYAATGAIVYYDGATLLGTASVGAPSISVTLAPGAHTLTATYVGDTNFATSTSGTAAVDILPPAAAFPNTAVGATSSQQTVTLYFTTGGTPATINVLTEGAPNLDFKQVSGGTCSTSTAYTASQICTANVTFSPSAPGPRSGAVVLRDGSGNVLAMAYLNGVGQGPQVVFDPGAPSTLANGFSVPDGLAMDGAGDIYASSAGSNNVIKIAAGTGTKSTVATSGTTVYSVAVDGAGNVFYTNQSGTKVWEVDAATGAVSSLAFSGLNSPLGIAVDNAGDVFVSDFSNDNVVELPWGGSGYGAQRFVVGGLNGPVGLAPDNLGNIYVADSQNNRVIKVNVSTGSYTAIGSGFNTPRVLGLDAAGDLYIGESGTGLLSEVEAGSGTQTTVASGLGILTGLIVDPQGNLYSCSELASTVLKFDRTTPPSLTFAATHAGFTSSDSPQTVTLDNIGNAALTFPVPGSGNAPTISSGFTLSNTSTCAQLTSSSGSSGSLSSGSVCTYLVTFSPTVAGANNGTLVIGDNSLNASPSTTQSILLSGPGLPGPAAQFVVSAPATALVGIPFNITVTAYDAYNNLVSTYNDTVHFTSTDASALLEAYTTLTSGTGTSLAELVTPGTQTITATDTVSAAITGTSGNITAVIPNFVVTVPTDTTSGTASNCTVQNLPGALPDANCSLRDAIAAADAVSTATVTPTITFASWLTGGRAATITLANGYLDLAKNVKITGPGASLLNVSGNNASNVFTVESGVTASITGLTIENGKAGFSGGGVSNQGTLTLSSCSVSNNSASEGGGIYNTGTLTISGCTLSGNSAIALGGFLVNTGTATISTSTISGNTVPSTGDDAGIYVFADTGQTAALTLTESTVSGNSGGKGVIDAWSQNGGNAVPGTITAHFTNDTIAGNNCDWGVGAYALNNSTQSTTFHGTVVAGNSGSQFTTEGSGASITSGGYNLFSDTSFDSYKVASDITSTDPVLSALGNYGGSTQTMALLPGSPAIDVGDPTDNSNDQRGDAVYNTVRDIGAFESQGFSLTKISGDSQTITAGTAFGSPLVVGVTANNAAEPVSGGVVTYTAPATGASLSPATSTVTIASGKASLTATANNVDGTYNVTASAVGAPSPVTFSETNQQITTSLTPTVMPSATFDYGAPAPAISVALTPSNATGITASDFTATLDGTTALTVTAGTGNTYNIVLPSTPLSVGGHSIQVAFAGTVTYKTSNTTINLTVNQATSSVSGTTPTMTYGQTGSSTITVAGEFSGAGIAVPSGTVTYAIDGGATQSATLTSGSATISVPILSAGAHSIVLSYGGDTNYQSSTGTVNFTVAKAALTVTADNASKTYGDVDPTLTATITGFVNGDTASVVNGSASLSASGTAGATRPAGTYTITPTLGTLTASNYTFTTFNTGTLTVNQAALTVTADNKSKTYGDVDPTLTSTITGFVNGETASVVSGSASLSASGTAGATRPAGTYTITPTLGTLTASNYTFTTFNTGTLTVNQAALTITANNQTRVYGVANPMLTASFMGFVNGDTAASLGGTLSCTTAATASSTVAGSPYVIACSGATSSNYSISYVPGTLTLTPAALSVTANNQSRLYGDANPTLDGTLTGAVASDGITASYATTATAASAIGPYPITATLVDPNSRLANYTVTNTPATLTVNAAPLTVTADNATRVYGIANPAFTGSVTGAKLTDTFTESFATTATTSSTVGTYDITPSVTGANLSDYTVTTTKGTLNITQASTSVALASSAAHALRSNPVTLTATVTSTSSGTPTGSVQFFDGTTSLGTVTLDSSGHAAFTTSLLSVATHSITAQYSGDTEFATSTSSSFSEVVEDFNFNIGIASVLSATVLPGGTATYTLQVSPTGASSFPSAVALSLSGLPAGDSYTITPATIAAGSGATTVTVTITTTKNVAMVMPMNTGNGRLPFLPVTFAMMLPFFGTRRSRRLLRKLPRNMLMLLLGAILLTGTLAMTACGGGGNGFFKDSPQTYTLTVTGTAGSLQHSQSLTLTVQ